MIYCYIILVIWYGSFICCSTQMNSYVMIRWKRIYSFLRVFSVTKSDIPSKESWQRRCSKIKEHKFVSSSFHNPFLFCCVLITWMFCERGFDINDIHLIPNFLVLCFYISFQMGGFRFVCFNIFIRITHMYQFFPSPHHSIRLVTFSIQNVGKNIFLAQIWNQRNDFLALCLSQWQFFFLAVHYPCLTLAEEFLSADHNFLSSSSCSVEQVPRHIVAQISALKEPAQYFLAPG